MGQWVTQWVKAILLITQKSNFSYFLMLLIKMVLFTFSPTKKRQRRRFSFNECFTCFLKSKDNMKI